MLTIDRAKSLLDYNPETGVFTWMVSTGRVKRGDVVHTMRPDGYMYVGLDKSRYLAHRLAWFYITGKWPKDQIDHINGDRRDNRAVNLREATGSENQANRLLPRNNTTGLVGVSWDKARQKWAVRTKAYGKPVHIGRFSTREEAAAAYDQFKLRRHPHFAALNSSVQAD